MSHTAGPEVKLSWEEMPTARGCARLKNRSSLYGEKVMFSFCLKQQQQQNEVLKAIKATEKEIDSWGGIFMIHTLLRSSIYLTEYCYYD